MVKYQKLANVIRKGILNGKYQPGDQLEREKDLCERYSVSRITVKRAVDELVAEGLVVKRRGAGSFVKSLDDSSMEAIGSAHQFGGFSDYYAGSTIRSDVIRFDIINPSEEIAAKLKISTEDFVYDIIRLRCADGEPIVVEYTKMPIQVIAGIRRPILEASIYHYIENELNLHIQSAHRLVRAVMPTEKECELLQLEKEMPVLEVAQVAFLDDGRPFEYSVSHHRADKSVFRAVSIC